MYKEVNPNRKFIGSCPHNSDLIHELTALCEKEDITLGHIEAIGAVRKARFGYYDQQNYKYHFLEIDRHMEILSCIGNISLNEEKPMVHAHITLSGEDGHAIGGHLAPGTIVFACEYIIHAYDNAALIRDYDETTGLRLWKSE